MAAAWGGDNRAMPAVLNPSPLFLPCAAGVEPLLADEVRAILTAAGYRIRLVTPVDQFLWSAHVEAVAVLEK